MSALPTLTPEALKSWTAHPFWSWMGIRVIDVTDGGATLAIDVQPHHRGGGGTSAVNGGVISALVDAAAGAAVATRNWPPHLVTIDLGVSYLEPAVGDRIEAEAKVLAGGRQFTFIEVEVRSENGRVAARGRASMRLFTRTLVDPEHRAVTVGDEGHDGQ